MGGWRATCQPPFPFTIRISPCARFAAKSRVERGYDRAVIPPARLSSPDAGAPSRSLLATLRDGASASPLTNALILLNVAAFVGMLVAGAEWGHERNEVQLAWGANFGPATRDGQWWRLGSAMFLHFGILHLGINMAALWDAGRFIERIYGGWRFLAIYLLSGLTGNLLSLVTHGTAVVSGGASGAVFGVFGALLAAIWRERELLRASEFRWLVWGGFAFTGANLGFGLLIPGIDNGAHFGGLLAGVIAGAGWLPRQTNAMRALCAGALVAAAVGMLVALPAPQYSWRNEQHAREEIRSFIWEDRLLDRHLLSVIGEGRRQRLSFDQLAQRIEHEVADAYDQSFDALSSLQLEAAAPSSATLESLRRYAEVRRDASRELAAALRKGDPGQASRALDKAKAARAQAGPAPSSAGERRPAAER